MSFEEWELKGHIEVNLNYLETKKFNRSVYETVCGEILEYASYGRDIAIPCERIFRVLKKNR